MRSIADATGDPAALAEPQWRPFQLAFVLLNLAGLADRLREVSCLYGFTRYEAAPTGSDGDIEDIQLSVRGAPISRDADWLPAIEQFGEGIFIHFDAAAIAAWLQKPATAVRQQKLLARYEH